MITHFKKSGLVAGLCLSLLTAPAVMPRQEQIPDRIASGSDSIQTLTAKLDFAHAQHEIIILYIQNSEFDKVWPAARLLLALRFPAEQEKAVVRSLAIVTEKLVEKGRSDLAHQILDAAATALEDGTNRSKTHLIQARIYKLEGQVQKAIESYRKSQEP